MEQIGRALSKAREQRGSGGGTGFASRLQDMKSAPSRAARSGGLSYTRTKVVPVSRTILKRNRIVSWALNDRLSDVYRLLRTQILQRMARANANTLGVTSASVGEGKTVTAANLALAIAMDVNQTVLLVDADLRAPGVHKMFGFEPDAGLDDFLAGRAELSECLVNPGLDRLVILPCRAPVETSAEVLRSPQMAELAQELKLRYPDRIIIYDLPPVLAAGDTVGFLPQVDATLLVVRDGMAKSAEVRRASEILSEFHLIGSVLNASW